ncbi:MAG: hypothetical protein HY719_06555 [Planctomycetes bacterium]|nr:hypothetical protein [Planctomycetota bacterium]
MALPDDVREAFDAWESARGLLLLRRGLGDTVAGWFDTARPALLRERLGRPVRALPGRGESAVYAAGGRTFVVKRCRHGGLLRPLTGDRFLRGGRFVEEVALTLRMARAGIATPAVVALALTRRWHGLLLAHLVTEEIPDARDLWNFVTAPENGPESRAGRARRREAIRAAGRVVRAFHDAGFYHADLNLRNLLAREGDPARALIIDVAGSRQRAAPLAEAERIDNLARLNRSLDKLCHTSGAAVPRADLLRFLSAYHRAGADAGATTPPLRHLAAAAAAGYTRLRRLLW